MSTRTAQMVISDPDFTLYEGDALEVLCELPKASVDCVVTSRLREALEQIAAPKVWVQEYRQAVDIARNALEGGKG